VRNQANNRPATADLLDLSSDLLEQRIGIGPYELPGKPGMGVQRLNKEPPGLQGEASTAASLPGLRLRS